MKDYLESGLSPTPGNRMQSRNQNYEEKIVQIEKERKNYEE